MVWMCLVPFHYLSVKLAREKTASDPVNNIFDENAVGNGIKLEAVLPKIPI